MKEITRVENSNPKGIIQGYMPVATLVPKVQPDPTALFTLPQGRYNPATTPRWYAAYCKSDQVRLWAHTLHAQGIPAYVPTVRSAPYKKHGRAGEWIESPLFAGYGFFAVRPGQPDDLFSARSSKRVVQIIEIKDQVLFCGQMAAIAAYLVINPWANAVANRFAVGSQVRVVVAGVALMATVDATDRQRVYLHCSMLGRAVDITADVGDVEAAN